MCNVHKKKIAILQNGAHTSLFCSHYFPMLVLHEKEYGPSFILSLVKMIRPVYNCCHLFWWSLYTLKVPNITHFFCTSTVFEPKTNEYLIQTTIRPPPPPPYLLTPPPTLPPFLTPTPPRHVPPRPYSAPIPSCPPAFHVSNKENWGPS